MVPAKAALRELARAAPVKLEILRVDAAKTVLVKADLRQAVKARAAPPKEGPRWVDSAKVVLAKEDRQRAA